MEQAMDREIRKQTEALTAQLHDALEGLARLHGEPRHIGAGIRREGKRKTVFIYIANPADGIERPGEIWLPQQVPYSVALLTHNVPMRAVADEDDSGPRFSRAPCCVNRPAGQPRRWRR